MNDFDIRYFLSIFWRRFPMFLVTAIVVFAGFAAAAVLMPPTFRSTSTILVESQQIPNELAQSTVTASAVERIRIIEQRLMTRATLLDIASKHGVYRDRPEMSPTDIFNAMRDSTEFQLVGLGGGRRGGSAIAFNLSFSASSGRTAAAVANEFVTLILEQNVKLRTGRASDTYAFFEQEGERLLGNLASIEREIVEFKRANRDTLPDSLEYRRNRLSLTQQRLSQRERDKSTLQEERRALVEAKADPTKLLNEQDRPRTQNERDLIALERERARQRALLSENHPRIRAIDARIAALEAAIDEEAQEMTATEAEEGKTREEQLLDQVDQNIAIIDAKLAAIDSEVADLERDQRQLERSIVETPSTEMALHGLTRNYQNMQAQYQNARSNLASAATGEQLELKQQAERFEIIEQAGVPDTPDKPNRLLIMAMGLGGGLGAGLGMVVLLEFLNRTIRRPSEIANALDIQPLAVIPYVYTVNEQSNRRRWRRGVLLTVVLLVTAVLAALHYFYLPLDLLAEQAIEKAQLDTLFGLIRARLGQ
jgi:polysaccharide chain length determinant protein (PEP-CTERM system associated)